MQNSFFNDNDKLALTKKLDYILKINSNLRKNDCKSLKSFIDHLVSTNR